MAYYAVYRISDGALISTSEDPDSIASDADLNAKGYAKKEVTDPRPMYRPAWNTTTLDFFDTPKTPEEIAAEQERPNAEARHRQAYQTLRDWANEARSASTAYTGMTTAQKNNAVSVLFNRFGRALDFLADQLLIDHRNQ